MVSQLHILLTYMCTKECDHCFVYSSPNATGTFSIQQLENVFSEASKLGSIEWIYFEGGEPFLFYPILLHGMMLAKNAGFKVGIVTNGFWATSETNIRYYLSQLQKIGLDDLSVSDDCFHMTSENDHPSVLVTKIATQLGMPVSTLTLNNFDDIPVEIIEPRKKGEPIIGGNIRLTGRAADKLTNNLLTQPSYIFNSCLHEELINPIRVHLDAFGYIHICQGISLGNMWEQPLSDIISHYDPYAHPIVKDLLNGGPFALATHYGISSPGQFIDSCHMCYEIRKVIRSYHPEFLQPNQVYNEP